MVEPGFQPSFPEVATSTAIWPLQSLSLTGHFLNNVNIQSTIAVHWEWVSESNKLEYYTGMEHPAAMWPFCFSLHPLQRERLEDRRLTLRWAWPGEGSWLLCEKLGFTAFKQPARASWACSQVLASTWSLFLTPTWFTESPQPCPSPQQPGPQTAPENSTLTTPPRPVPEESPLPGADRPVNKVV